VLRERHRIKPRGPPPAIPVAAEWGISPPPRPSFGQPLMNGPPPIPIPIPSRRVGPCYVCGQFGYLKRNCPRLLPQQYPFHSNVVDIPHTVCDGGNAGSVVCVNVSVSGGKSEVRANDSATEYGISLASQKLETISAQCPLLHSNSVDKDPEPNACLEEAQDGKMQGVDSTVAEPREPHDSSNGEFVKCGIRNSGITELRNKQKLNSCET